MPLMNASQAIHSFVDWIHLFCAIVWIGGLFFYVAVFLPSLKTLDTFASQRLIQVVGVRLRALTLVCITALLLTGLFLLQQIIQGISSSEGFFTSPYGRILAVKVLLGLAAISAGSYIGFVLAPRLTEAIETTNEMQIQAVGKKIGRFIIASLVLGLLVSICVALLHTTA